MTYTHTDIYVYNKPFKEMHPVLHASKQLIYAGICIILDIFCKKWKMFTKSPLHSYISLFEKNICNRKKHISKLCKCNHVQGIFFPCFYVDRKENFSMKIFPTAAKAFRKKELKIHTSLHYFHKNVTVMCVDNV